MEPLLLRFFLTNTPYFNCGTPKFQHHSLWGRVKICGYSEDGKLHPDVTPDVVAQVQEPLEEPAAADEEPAGPVLCAALTGAAEIPLLPSRIRQRVLARIASCDREVAMRELNATAIEAYDLLETLEDEESLGRTARRQIRQFMDRYEEIAELTDANQKFERLQAWMSGVHRYIETSEISFLGQTRRLARASEQKTRELTGATEAFGRSRSVGRLIEENPALGEALEHYLADPENVSEEDRTLLQEFENNAQIRQLWRRLSRARREWGEAKAALDAHFDAHPELVEYYTSLTAYQAAVVRYLQLAALGGRPTHEGEKFFVGLPDAHEVRLARRYGATGLLVQSQNWETRFISADGRFVASSRTLEGRHQTIINYFDSRGRRTGTHVSTQMQDDEGQQYTLVQSRDGRGRIRREEEKGRGVIRTGDWYDDGIPARVVEEHEDSSSVIYVNERDAQGNVTSSSQHRNNADGSSILYLTNRDAQGNVTFNGFQRIGAGGSEEERLECYPGEDQCLQAAIAPQEGVSYDVRRFSIGNPDGVWLRTLYFDDGNSHSRLGGDLVDALAAETDETVRINLADDVAMAMVPLTGLSEERVPMVSDFIGDRLQTVDNADAATLDIEPNGEVVVTRPTEHGGRTVFVGRFQNGTATAAQREADEAPGEALVAYWASFNAQGELTSDAEVHRLPAAEYYGNGRRLDWSPMAVLGEGSSGWRVYLRDHSQRLDGEWEETSEEEIASWTSYQQPTFWSLYGETAMNDTPVVSQLLQVGRSAVMGVVGSGYWIAAGVSAAVDADAATTSDLIHLGAATWADVGVSMPWDDAKADQRERQNLSLMLARDAMTDEEEEIFDENLEREAFQQSWRGKEFQGRADLSHRVYDQVFGDAHRSQDATLGAFAARSFSAAPAYFFRQAATADTWYESLGYGALGVGGAASTAFFEGAPLGLVGAVPGVAVRGATSLGLAAGRLTPALAVIGEAEAVTAGTTRALTFSERLAGSLVGLGISPQRIVNVARIGAAGAEYAQLGARTYVTTPFVIGVGAQAIDSVPVFARLAEDPDSVYAQQDAWEAGGGLVTAATLLGMARATHPRTPRGTKALATRTQTPAVADTFDPYRALGLERNASMEQVRRAYRRLAFENHPDRVPGAQAEARMRDINRAYEAIQAERAAAASTPTAEQTPEPAPARPGAQPAQGAPRALPPPAGAEVIPIETAKGKGSSLRATPRTDTPLAPQQASVVPEAYVSLTEEVRAYDGPDGRYLQARENFVEFLPNSEGDIPSAHWKFHVSATPENAAAVVRLATGYLRGQRIRHKIVSSEGYPRFFGEDAGTQQGKLVTVWCENAAQARNLMNALDGALAERGLTGTSTGILPPENNPMPGGDSGLISYRFALPSRGIDINGRRVYDSYRNRHQNRLLGEPDLYLVPSAQATSSRIAAPVRAGSKESPPPEADLASDEPTEDIVFLDFRGADAEALQTYRSALQEAGVTMIEPTGDLVAIGLPVGLGSTLLTQLEPLRVNILGYDAYHELQGTRALEAPFTDTEMNAIFTELTKEVSTCRTCRPVQPGGAGRALPPDAQLWDYENGSSLATNSEIARWRTEALTTASVEPVQEAIAAAEADGLLAPASWQGLQGSEGNCVSHALANMSNGRFTLTQIMNIAERYGFDPNDGLYENQLMQVLAHLQGLSTGTGDPVDFKAYAISDFFQMQEARAQTGIDRPAGLAILRTGDGESHAVVVRGVVYIETVAPDGTRTPEPHVVVTDSHRNTPLVYTLPQFSSSLISDGIIVMEPLVEVPASAIIPSVSSLGQGKGAVRPRAGGNSADRILADTRDARLEGRLAGEPPGQQTARIIEATDLGGDAELLAARNSAANLARIDGTLPQEGPACAIHATHNLLAAMGVVELNQSGLNQVMNRARELFPHRFGSDGQIVQGLSHGEVMELARSFGRARVAAIDEFFETIERTGKPMLAVIEGQNSLHAVVVEGVFEHGGQSYVSIIDSNWNNRRLFMPLEGFARSLRSGGLQIEPGEPTNSTELAQVPPDHSSPLIGALPTPTVTIAPRTPRTLTPVEESRRLEFASRINAGGPGWGFVEQQWNAEVAVPGVSRSIRMDHQTWSHILLGSSYGRGLGTGHPEIGNALSPEHLLSIIQTTRNGQIQADGTRVIYKSLGELGIPLSELPMIRNPETSRMQKPTHIAIVYSPRSGQVITAVFVHRYGGYRSSHQGQGAFRFQQLW
ncbi:MAG: DnaJ domain-containing protein [Elusimicrobia bacterium]|nr:DnaJ domain-containing protein [Elusimicrobiota bacterium]